MKNLNTFNVKFQWCNCYGMVIIRYKNTLSLKVEIKVCNNQNNFTQYLKRIYILGITRFFKNTSNT